MNQLFTRLLILTIGLAGLAMPQLFAQPDGFGSLEGDDEPCFAIWDTDEDRGKGPILKRYLGIFIPNTLSYTQYKAVVHFFDQNGNLIIDPNTGAAYALSQPFNIPNTNPALQDSSFTDGEAIAFEIPIILNQITIAEIALNLYGRTTTNWDPIQSNTGIPRWDPNDPNREKICWTHTRAIVHKGYTKREGVTKATSWFSPNPATDKLLVQGGESLSKISLFNTHGQLLRQWVLPASKAQHKISLGPLPPGIYLLRRQIGLTIDTQRLRLQ